MRDVDRFLARDSLKISIRAPFKDGTGKRRKTARRRNSLRFVGEQTVVSPSPSFPLVRYRVFKINKEEGTQGRVHSTGGRRRNQLVDSPVARQRCLYVLCQLHSDPISEQQRYAVRTSAILESSYSVAKISNRRSLGVGRRNSRALVVAIGREAAAKYPAISGLNFRRTGVISILVMRRVGSTSWHLIRWVRQTEIEARR